MKIAFVGKGGSGKTTLSALFIRSLASQESPVLAIDADINRDKLRVFPCGRFAFDHLVSCVLHT